LRELAAVEGDEAQAAQPHAPAFAQPMAFQAELVDGLCSEQQALIYYAKLRAMETGYSYQNVIAQFDAAATGRVLEFWLTF
jgi:hypothetical protein